MLKKGLSLVKDLVCGHFGAPAALRQLLGESGGKLVVSSLEPASGTVSAGGVPRWHQWAETSRDNGAVFGPGEILGWKTHRNFGYRSYRVVRPELAGFGGCARIPGWRCDIQDVAGLHAAKADLARFDSLDAMAQQGSRALVSEPSAARLSALLAQREVRALRRQKGADPFVRYLWDGRLFWLNSGGSHHFAAARYIAGRLGQPVPLCAELRVYSIEPVAVSALRRDFELFAVSARDAGANVRFHDALRKLRAHYLCKRMPQPLQDVEVIFLPRGEKRSLAIAAELRAAGFPDVGKHLSALVLRQHMNLVRHGDGQQVQAA